jgi:acyl CoA:acetate/3-ketoacid CoA transferase alpha subunit
MAGEGLDDRLALLERKQSLLVAHVRALRAANETLRGELALEQARNRALAERLRAAGTRLDALLMRLPEAAE